MNLFVGILIGILSTLIMLFGYVLWTVRNAYIIGPLKILKQFGKIQLQAHFVETGKQAQWSLTDAEANECSTVLYKLANEDNSYDLHRC